MFGTVSEEIEVNVPASEAWKLYGTLELGYFVVQEMPDLITKVDVLHGDGGPETILEVFWAPGSGGLASYKEKLTVVDNGRRVKEVEIIEGGFLDLGFTLYRTRFEMVEKEGTKRACITRTTIEYEVKEEAKENASFVSIHPLVALMKAAAQYLLERPTYNEEYSNTRSSSGAGSTDGDKGALTPKVLKNKYLQCNSFSDTIDGIDL